MQSIVARYTRDDKEYSVVVIGHDKELNGTAPDIVAARKLADGLVKKIATEPPAEPVVVHLLDNSAVEFTRAYLDATLFGHQSNRKKDTPQSGKASARRHRRAPGREPGATGDAQQTSADGAIIEEKPTGDTRNDTEEAPGASSS